MAAPGRGRLSARATRAALLAVAGVAALAVLLRLLYGPGDLGFDGAFSLVWGDELRHLHAPDYGAGVTPTPHPLANVVAALVSLAGQHGPGVLLALSFASFAALGIVAFVVGRRSFGAVAGAVFAVLLLTRPLLVGEMLQASTDIPFLALVLGAVALELRAERRGAPVLATLALAGLLRPEAWLLSGAYLVFLLAPAERRADRRRALALAALTVSAPVAWLLFDLVTSGNALHSFTRTQDLAAHLQRERGTGAALRELPADLRTVLGDGVTWLGIAVGAVAVLSAQRRARLGLALLIFGIVNFLALGVAQLPLINRYLLVPGVAVALFCAAGAGAFAWLPAQGRPRLAGPAISAVVVVVLLLGAADARTDLRGTVAHANARHVLYANLLDLADTAQARGLVARCPRVQVAVYRPVPVLAYRLGLRPSDIEVVRPVRARDGAIFAARLEAVVGDVGLYPGIVIPSDQLRLAADFTRLRRTAWGTLATRGC